MGAYILVKEKMGDFIFERLWSDVKFALDELRIRTDLQHALSDIINNNNL